MTALTVGLIRALGGAVLTKRYQWDCPVHVPNMERGHWPSLAAVDASGAWREGPQVGKGVVLHDFRQEIISSLADLPALLTQLESYPAISIALGTLRPEAVIENDGVWSTTAGRVKRNYEDTPNHLLVLDLDSLVGDIADAADVVRDALYEVPELDGCAHVAAYSPSAGIKSGIRVRVFFETKKALTLNEQALWVKGVNQRLGKKFFDPALYSPGHIVATAAPILFALSGKQSLRMPRPVPAMRVWYKAGDVADIDVVGTAQAAGLTAEQIATLESMASQSGGVAEAHEWMESIAPGNCSIPIHKLICRAAFTAPETKQDERFAALHASVRRKVMEVSTDGKFAERDRVHLNLNRWWQTWREARARKPKIIQASTPAPAASPTQPTYSAQPGEPPRSALVRLVGMAADQILDQKTPVHAIVTAPPGAGKSYALKSVCSLPRLMNRRILVSVPTHDLGSQMTHDLQNHAHTLAPNGQQGTVVLSQRVRHHKGRTQPGMCINPTFDEQAKRAEGLGLSPKKSVCSKCPDRADCPWIKQGDDIEPGVIVTTHSALLNEPSADWAELLVVDESLAGAIIDADEEESSIEIDTLDAIKGIYRAHADLIKWRTTLKVYLLGNIPSETKDRGLLPIQHPLDIDEALAAEERHRTTIQNAIQTEKTFHRNRAHYKQSLLVTKLLQAIQNSTKLGRAYVFGARVWKYRQKINGHWRVTKKVCTYSRHRLPVESFQRGAIYLDGTAKLDPTLSVWRAIASPDEQPMTETHIHVDMPIGAVHATQCVDASWAQSSVLDKISPEDDSDGAIEDMEAFARAPWVRAAMGEQGVTLQQVNAATAGALKLQKQSRKLRSDSRLFNTYLTIVQRALVTQGTLLLVAQLSLIERLKALGLPPNVACEHYGALRGLNRYANVPAAIIIGRPAVSNATLEMLTEALYMDAPSVSLVATATQWGRAAVPVPMADGREATLLADMHPDIRCRAVQSMISHAEVIQAVARIRPYDRGPTNPCELLIMGRLPAGMPLHDACDLADVTPSVPDLMLGYGALFRDQILNAAVYPDLTTGAEQTRWSRDGRGATDANTLFEQTVVRLASMHAEVAANSSQVSSCNVKDSACYPYIRIEGGIPRNANRQNPCSSNLDLLLGMQVVKFTLGKKAIATSAAGEKLRGLAFGRTYYVVLGPGRGRDWLEHALALPVRQYAVLQPEQIIELGVRTLAGVVARSASQYPALTELAQMAVDGRADPIEYVRDWLGWAI